jgi:hypothetical protein
MPKFPVDAPIREVIKALGRLSFRVVREGNHIAMVRENPDGTRTPSNDAQSFADKGVNPADNTHSSRHSKRRVLKRLRRELKALHYI